MWSWCARRIDFVAGSTVYLWDFGTVPTLWDMFLNFISVLRKYKNITLPMEIKKITDLSGPLW